jgi:hypothetical protein
MKGHVSVFLSITALLTLLVSCGGIKSSRYLKKDNAVFNLRMEQGACFGTCPVFNMDIDHKGNAVLEAIRFLPNTGIQEVKLPMAEVDSLKFMLHETSFFELDTIYDNPGLADLATTYIRVSLGEGDKKIQTVKGRFETPEDFNQLVGFLNRLRKRNF